MILHFTNSLLQLLHLLFCLMDIHVNYVHFCETLQDFPEQVIFELIIGLDVELLKEVILEALVLCIV